MKNQSLVALTLALIGTALVAANVHAAENGPCREIRTACESAGFTKGGHKPKKNEFKGLYKDCVQKIMTGETVAGVTVSPEVVNGCKEKKSKREAKKEAKSAGVKSVGSVPVSAPVAAPVSK
ncbi:MAG: hypothetical protein H7301_07415 [Cryobacterium sp.]|nr:hypothetical protein [Oligoflexia bacterium]